MTEEALFHLAQSTPTVDRAAVLAAACAGDATLRRRIEALLHAHENPASFMGGPAPGLAAELAATEGPPLLNDDLAAAGPRPVAEGPGSRIGPYTLLEQVGEGGMGVVFMAEQSRPVRRRVALKVIKAGMDTRQVVARFEAERQALALMDHPNIARVLDAGATDSGRPYFVMELVRGVPITTYCDEHRLSPRDRLGLFVQVCQAVQHAHQKGVIHRDLKPGNVLVALYDDRPVPKVIDFGIAKAAGATLTDRTAFTGLGAVVGTLEYMSPEQAQLNQLDVDTRSDVYSLGVLLYELLTGSTPVTARRFRAEALQEALRIIREDEPPKPSTRLGTTDGLPSIAASRGLEPARLSGVVRGELDWIVMKALEKDRARRYESAAGLAGDVRRYLNDEPVLACRPGARYRLMKLAKRNKRALTTFAFAGIILLATLAAAAGSVGWAVRDGAARRAEADRDRAAQHARADREADLTVREAALRRDQGDWATARAAVGRAEWLLAGGGSDVNRLRIRAVRVDLDMVARLEEVRLGSTSDPPATAIPYARSGSDYATAFADYGIDVVTLDAETAAARVRASAVRGELAAALDDWMWAKLRQDWLLRILRQPGAAKYSALLTRNPRYDARREAAAAPPVRASARGRTATVPYEHLRAVADLAAPSDLGRQVRDPVVQKDRRALEELADRPDVAALPASTAVLLARLLGQRGATAKAAELLYAVQQRAPHDFVVSCELSQHLTSNRTEPGRPDEAIGFMRAAVAARPHNAALHRRLGDMLADAGRHGQAVGAYQRAVELRPDDPAGHRGLGDAFGRTGNWDHAVAAHGRSVALDPMDGVTHHGLGQAYRGARQWDKAFASLRKACDLWPKNAAYHGDLAWLLATCPDVSLRDPAQATGRAETAIELDPRRWSGWRALGAARLRAGDSRGAIEALLRANELSSGGSGYEWFLLAMARAQEGDQRQARPWYDRAVRWRKDQGGTDANPARTEELDRLGAEAARLLGVEVPPAPAAEEFQTGPAS